MQTKLKRFRNLPKDLLDTCITNDLTTAKDVLGRTDIDLLAKLDVCYEDVQLLLDTISKQICPSFSTVCLLLIYLNVILMIQ